MSHDTFAIFADAHSYRGNAVAYQEADQEELRRELGELQKALKSS